MRRCGVAIETAVHEELAIALGARRYERHGERRGYRNGVKTRTLTGPTGPMALTLPRATLAAPGRGQEWTSSIVRLCRFSTRLGTPPVNTPVTMTQADCLTYKTARKGRGARDDVPAVPLARGPEPAPVLSTRRTGRQPRTCSPQWCTTQ
jgi:hypothetical protein